MAGGTWNTTNKVRPGVYINFVSEAKAVGSVSDRGIVSLALPLSWGPAKQVITAEAGADTTSLLGYSVTDARLLLVREALKRAKTLLLYRLNSGVKAAATMGDLTVTAKHGGVRGNDITLVVQVNVDDADLFDVKTFVSGEEKDAQTVAGIADLQANDWVVFGGTGDLSASAGTPLTGGADGTVSNQDYVDYLAAVELHDFQTVALPSTDSSLKALYASFVRRLREEEGKKVQAVLENYPLADYEGIISVKNGVVLNDGTVLSAAQATAWVAGATAGAGLNESLTYQVYDDASDVGTRYTNSQIEAALRGGEFVFTPGKDGPVVEQDINTLTSISPNKNKAFSKNRVIRVLDGLAADFKRIFESYYIGQVDNNADGRNLFRNECISYLTTLQNMNAIQAFNAQTDVIVSEGGDTDSIIIETAVQPVDSVEKIYTKVTVK
ncbi:phage tail sheath family protein [Paenibacillus sp. y28]|uniref:phage tail sheath family protein n=1 Tax=Paenibacillus sp. y28 TaxID=3129110 RepID=UPI00301791AE